MSEVIPLDRNGPVPLYYQLRQALLAEIRQSKLQPGDQLPTELDIERRYQVSRSTIRQAITDLVADGIVERIQGKGTFVAAPKIRHMPQLTSFKENMLSQGYVPDHRTLESRVIGATAAVGATLELAEGTPCRFLRRLLLADGAVIGAAETWIPQEVLGGHDGLFDQATFAAGSLYDLLEGPPIALALAHGIERIRAQVAGALYGALLGCGADEPVLSVDRVTYDVQERAVEWTQMVFIGSRYEYPVKMRRPERGRRGAPPAPQP
jgi:GntR family transcriptional regulator